MFRRIVSAIKSGFALVAGSVFALVAAPIIHLSGLDNVDSCPTPEDIERSQKLVAEMKEKYGHKDPA